MAKIILSKREADLFKTGHAAVPHGKEKFGCVPGFNSSSANPDLDEWRKAIIDAVNTLAGHLGGCGIDFLDESGVSLDSFCPQNFDHYTFRYNDPLLNYRKALGSKMVSIFDFKDN